jgi:hypothetical protein
MRGIAAIAVVIASSAGVAAADECTNGPGPYLVCGVERPRHPHAAVWYDASLLYTQFEFNGSQVEGEMLRVGPRVSFGSAFYLGAEADFGQISSVNRLTFDSARTAETGPTPMLPPPDALGGTFGALKLVGGVHANAGILSGGAEVAAGLRLVAITSDETGVVSSGESAALEGRARLDLWLTPRLTVGAVAGVDLTERNDVTLGVTVGLHFHRFDRVR